MQHSQAHLKAWLSSTGWEERSEGGDQEAMTAASQTKKQTYTNFADNVKATKWPHGYMLRLRSVAFDGSVMASACEMSYR